MLVSLEWLKEWVAIDGDAERLAADLTTAGFEVESILPVTAAFAGVRVARIVELAPHPRAAGLAVCTIDDGHARHTVVCGAPNAAVGLRVPFAGIGARLPNSAAVAPAELGGVVSEGMLCSAAEVGIGPDADGLMVLAQDAPLGAALDAYLRLADHVLDVNITPNRGDCFSVLGIAREIAAFRGVPLGGPRAGAIPAASVATFPVTLEAGAACPSFAARVIEGLNGGARSPDWLTERLRRVGQRAVHPVVDVTNYVMLELGQPLHAYDLGALGAGIRVRHAQAGERLELLDGKEISLEPDVLVIADASGAIGLAGIMGGARTAVTAQTSNVLLESAYFAPEALLGRARRYGLHTDASMRFERGVDPTGQRRAIERATELLQAIAGGRAGPVELTEAASRTAVRGKIELRGDEIEAVLGMPLAAGDVETILAGLGMKVERRSHGWAVTPPAFRFDVAIEADVIEELARRTGYDNIPALRGPGAPVLGRATEGRVDEATIGDTLVARGYSEVVTYSFVDAAIEGLVNPGRGLVELANPLSPELGVLRRSLWPGLLRVAQQNLARQLTRLRIFEVGRQFAPADEGVREELVVAGLAVGPLWPEHWGHERREVDFFDLKGDVECLLSLTGTARELTFVADKHPALHPGQTASVRRGGETLGWIGMLHPGLQKRLDLKSPIALFALEVEKAFAAQITSYSQVSKFPSLRRDLAVVIDAEMPVAALLTVARSAGAPLLRSIEVFDLYRGAGIDSSRKSIGLGLILQDASRTLTDEDADLTVDSVVRRLEHELGATIRTQ